MLVIYVWTRSLAKGQSWYQIHTPNFVALTKIKFILKSLYSLKMAQEQNIVVIITWSCRIRISSLLYTSSITTVRNCNSCESSSRVDNCETVSFNDMCFITVEIILSSRSSGRTISLKYNTLNISFQSKGFDN